MSQNIPSPPTLGNFYDALRRWCEVTPPVDLSLGSVGQQPTWQPNPSNAVLNQAVNAAIDLVNRLVCVGPIQDILPSTVAACPGYQRGPYYVDFTQGLLYNPVPFEVVNCVWQNANGGYTRLEPENYYKDDQGSPPKFSQFQQLLPQPQPQNWFVIGTQVGLTPPPNQGGSLIISGMYGMNQMVSLTDTLGQFPWILPYPFQDVIQYIAMLFLCARTLKDTNYAARAQQFLPLASDGITSIYNWKNGRNPEGLARTLDTLRMLTGVRLGQTTKQNAPQSSQG